MVKRHLPRDLDVVSSLSMLIQPAPVAALTTALIDIECLSHSLAASRDDLDRFFPTGEPWPRTQPKFKDYLESCRGRSRPGDGPLNTREARQVWGEMMRDRTRWRELHDGLATDYDRWRSHIEDAIRMLPKLIPLLQGVVPLPRRWTSTLRMNLHRVRGIVFRAGARPHAIAAAEWTRHMRPINDARCFLQAADFEDPKRPDKPAGWTKAELIEETGLQEERERISPSMFDNIRKRAKVRGSTRGNQTWRYGRHEVRLLVATARSGKFPRKGKAAAAAWSALLGEPDRRQL